MQNNEINIIIISSDYYVPYTCVCIYSILKNKKTADILHFYIVSENISESNKKALISVVSPFKCFVDFKIVSKKMIEKIAPCSLERTENVCNYRLYLSSLFDFDRAFMLDADMIAVQNITDVYDMDMTDCPIAGVKDPVCNLYQEERLDIPLKYRYFNNGVLLLNLKYWRDNHVEDTFNELAEKYKEKMFIPDQDIYNMAFVKKAKYIPLQYNVFASISVHNFPKELKESQINPVILHWADKKKPWNHIHINYANVFWKYARDTPLYAVILERFIQEESLRINKEFLKHEDFKNEVLSINNRFFLYSDAFRNRISEMTYTEAMYTNALDDHFKRSISKDFALVKLRKSFLKKKIRSLKLKYFIFHKKKYKDRIVILQNEISKF